MNFPQLKRLYSSFAEYLNANGFAGTPHKLYEAQNYILNLGGKRIRPIALLAALEAYDKDIAKGMHAAFAFEVFHNFTLVHDDIMDKSPKRRGHPTVHKKYSIPTAILAGDNMLLYSYKELANYTDKDIHFKLSNLLTETGILICEGQAMDMEFEKINYVKEQDYLKMIELKTDVLLGACLKAGAIIGKSSDEDAENLYHFGINLGISFQIMDDILDAFSNDKKVGKVKGGDIIANKKTLLLINAMVLANKSQREKLDYWLTLNDFDAAEKVDAILRVFSELNIRNLAEEKMVNYYNKALQYLKKVNITKEQGESLHELAAFLKSRKH